MFGSENGSALGDPQHLVARPVTRYQLDVAGSHAEVCSDDATHRLVRRPVGGRRVGPDEEPAVTLAVDRVPTGAGDDANVDRPITHRAHPPARTTAPDRDFAAAARFRIIDLNTTPWNGHTDHQ